jgi:eukaryotic-like serine/threonine-protein kinase
VIGGRYRLEHEIGRGSMGTVYQAVHITLGQRVAIKLISGEHAHSAEARQRFSVEAKAAAKLRSRHVVQVIDDGETSQGNPYIVLELLEGETLEQRIERDHDLPLADAIRVATHVGRALARAHAQGIVHRDLKPANIFLVKSDDDEAGWVAKVLDFGIAKLAHENGTTRAGTVLGTPLFMSPEQVRGASSVDHRADLYSLGMCVFHALTGDYAYYSPNYSDILVGICTQPLPRLREKAPWLPEAVEPWFQRACAREPLERFQSADEMTEALQASAGATTPLSKHKSVPEGRIAPETLVGFAAPALATLQLDAAPLGLGLTQALAPPPVSAPPVTSIVVASGRETAATTGVEPSARGRNFRPLLVGLGLGLLALTSLGATLLLIGNRRAGSDTQPEASRGRRASLPEPRPASPPELDAALREPRLFPSSSVSSVTAETAPLPVLRKPASARGTAKKSSAVLTTSPSPSAPATAAAGKPAGSDLGF